MTGEVSASTVGFQLFNQAADNNKSPICEQLQKYITAGQSVLEIGSGSGQHVVYFSQRMPEVAWQPSDRGDYHEALVHNLSGLDLPNVRSPIYLDAATLNIPGSFDAAFSANVFHIMPVSLMQPLVEGVARVLNDGGRFFVYGPFKYNGVFTTESNARFDGWLKGRDPAQGIRDIELLKACAADSELALTHDVAMPANNQFLVFEKSSSG